MLSLIAAQAARSDRDNGIGMKAPQKPNFINGLNSGQNSLSFAPKSPRLALLRGAARVALVCMDSADVQVQ
jgi:hypothetical protein